MESEALGIFFLGYAATIKQGCAQMKNRVAYLYAMRWLLFLMLLGLLVGCHRNTCPAYQDGAVTGMEGEQRKSKRHNLFSDKMMKDFERPVK